LVNGCYCLKRCVAIKHLADEIINLRYIRRGDWTIHLDIYIGYR
jgi:hypothetical protein